MSYRAYGGEGMQFGPRYIIPKPFDARVLYWVAPAVAQAAMETGAAREKIDIGEYREQLMRKLSRPGACVTWEIMDIAEADLQRIVFPEGEEDKISAGSTDYRGGEVSRVQSCSAAQRRLRHVQARSVWTCRGSRSSTQPTHRSGSIRISMRCGRNVYEGAHTAGGATHAHPQPNAFWHGHGARR